MKPKYELLEVLADGKFHSGEDLADRSGVSRAAIWKQLKRLAEKTGLKIFAVRGRGYRLQRSLELFDRNKLRARLGDTLGSNLQHLWIVQEVDSTNNYIRNQPYPSLGTGVACIAEYQSAGRGRRGRTWLSPYGANLMLSVGWRFDLPMSAVSGLSLAVGVALAEVLEVMGLNNQRLKWPNDLHVRGRKLAGILVDAIGEADGPAMAIIGIGLNLHMPKEVVKQIDQPSTDLEGAGLSKVSRNDLAARVLEKLVVTCKLYDTGGLEPFLPAWRRFDGYLGQEVHLIVGKNCHPGRYIGIREDGALILENNGRQRAFHAGEVSLRSAPDGPNPG